MIKRFIVSNGESSLATFLDIIEKVQNSYIPNEIRVKELISYTRNSMTTMTTEDLNLWKPFKWLTKYIVLCRDA